MNNFNSIPSSRSNRSLTSLNSGGVISSSMNMVGGSRPTSRRSSISNNSRSNNRVYRGTPNNSANSMNRVRARIGNTANSRRSVYRQILERAKHNRNAYYAYIGVRYGTIQNVPNNQQRQVLNRLNNLERGVINANAMLRNSMRRNNYR